MDTQAIVLFLFIALAVPAYIALGRASRVSRSRLLHVSDKMVTIGLTRERKGLELDIAQSSLQSQLFAIRNCEQLIFGTVPDQDHPEDLRAVVNNQKANQHLESLMEYSKSVELNTKKQLEQIETNFEEKRTRIQSMNQRFRSMDRFFTVSTTLLRFLLVATALYAVFDLAFV
ncbi:hypothetical protein ABZ635_05935 [Nocardiopsis sp. NPDC007018]|uniref:hypothetical protein n=1 Tax=Nocardiopsis sp. NPDC007018 TaxID=3155721 RepID=UPI0033F886CC